MSNNSIKFLANNDEVGQRLDLTLVKRLPDLSRSNLKKIIELKQVKINNSFITSPSKKIKHKDTIYINLILEPKNTIIPSKMKLDYHNFGLVVFFSNTDNEDVIWKCRIMVHAAVSICQNCN